MYLRFLNGRLQQLDEDIGGWTEIEDATGIDQPITVDMIKDFRSQTGLGLRESRLRLLLAHGDYNKALQGAR